MLHYALEHILEQTEYDFKLFKNRMHRILELELEQTNNDCTMF